MLSVAIALALSQTTVADKPTVIIHNVTATANCPNNTVLEASNPAIARPQIGGGPRSGFPDMVHMPPVYVVSTLLRTINGCNAPLIRDVLFTGKPVATDHVETVPLKPAP